MFIAFVDTPHKPDIRGYCNPFPPRFSEKAQAGILTGQLYTEDKGGKVIDSLIRSIRKGSIVQVADCFLLAPIRGQTRTRREALLDRLDRIKKRGGVILCLATGYRSDNRSQCNRMLLRAYEMMGRSGQGAPGRRKEGRPAVEWTKHEIDIMEGAWHRRSNTNNDERRVDMRKRLGKEPPGMTWLRNKFGSPRGKGD